jgi:hypothetical protein
MANDWNRILGAGPDPALAGMQQAQQQAQPGFWNNLMTGFGDTMGDPNIRRAMGQMGAKLGGPGSWQEAVGGTADQLNRTQAMQRAGAEVAKQSTTPIQQMIHSLFGEPGGGVGDPDDPDTANQFTVGPDGITVKIPNPATVAKKRNQWSPQRSLESEVGGQDKAMSGYSPFQ